MCLRSRCWYLAICNRVELLTDLLWQGDAVFFGRERMRGGQSIYCKCTMDVIKDYQIFLRKKGRQDTANVLQTLT